MNGAGSPGRPARAGNGALTIDGSMGEGGGQILRSALALSLCTGIPFRIADIRGRRGRPGLRAQHLAAVHAAAGIAGARVRGAGIGARELSFEPGSVRPGDYHFRVGTAGSATLVLQTVLPALLTASAPSRLRIEGGTHNPQAPSFDFLARAYLPLLERMGPRIHAALQRAGFFPGGGGDMRVTVEPSSRLEPLLLLDRGRVLRVRAEVTLSRLPSHIAEREAGVLREALDLAPEAVAVRIIEDSPGPGNVVTVFLESEHIVEVITAFGRRGVPAEQVARTAVAGTTAYLAAGVPVGPCLADQLLLPLALAGDGAFVTMTPTQHTQTNRAVIERFLPVRIEIAQTAASPAWTVRVRRRA